MRTSVTVLIIVTDILNLHVRGILANSIVEIYRCVCVCMCWMQAQKGSREVVGREVGETQRAGSAKTREGGEEKGGGEKARGIDLRLRGNKRRCIEG